MLGPSSYYPDVVRETFLNQVLLIVVEYNKNEEEDCLSSFNLEPS